MKVSVFTPSHNPKYLRECFKSLQAQTFTDWEWIVLLNGGAGREWYTAPIKADKRVKVRQVLDGVANVGALKRKACNLATGDYLVEFDHDDVMLPHCLEEVVAAFEQHPGVGLVYSDCSQINEDGSPNFDQFNAAHGWLYYGMPEGDVTYSVAHSSEPYPQNASTIYYAPNHVRAYRRSVYEQVGGHDDTFKVCDDQDLCSRMYQVADFYHINRCLYFQRMHKFNTQRDTETNAAIQNINAALYERDVQANALAWAHRRRLSCFDLGSGPGGPPVGYSGIDMHDYALDARVIVGDVFNVLTACADESVGVIRAVDFLEHIPPSRVVELMNLMWRKLAHGGFLFSMTPSTDGRGAWEDPTHISFWNEHSFHYYTMTHKAQFVPEIECRFNISRLVTVSSGPPENIPYTQANLVAIHDGPRQYGLTFW